MVRFIHLNQFLILSFVVLTSLPGVAPDAPLKPDPTPPPTGLPTARSSSTPSDESSGLPTAKSSSTPSAEHTGLPTVPPTDPPTTSCVDSTEAKFSYKKYNDALIFKTEKPDRKCKSLEQENDITIKMNCANKFEIADNCKLTCDNCDNPTDSPTTCSDLKVSGVTFAYNKYTNAGTIKKTKKGRKCQALAEEKKSDIEKNCAAENIRDYCKLTCDNCGDDVCFDNDDEKFDVNHSSGKDKGCVWLRNQNTAEEQVEICECTDARKICKETCDCKNDNDDERFDVNHSSGKPKGCVWLRNQNTACEQAEICEIFTDAKNICKETCDIKDTCDFGCTSAFPTTVSPTTSFPTTSFPTTSFPTTSFPTTSFPTTSSPTTSSSPTTLSPTTSSPTTPSPTTSSPTTSK